MTNDSCRLIKSTKFFSFRSVALVERKSRGSSHLLFIKMSEANGQLKRKEGFGAA
jgi:hypothetical protein